MEYPHGRHHGGHHRRDEEEGRYGHPPPLFGADPPPPPFFGGDAPPPPFFGGNAPPPPFFGGDAPPPPFFGGKAPTPPFYGGNAPPPPQVYHTSHMGPPGPDTAEHPHHHPHIPPTADHHHHRTEDELNNKPSVKMYCKADTNYALTIRDGKVVLAPADPSDPRQQWTKDEKFSTRVKDEEGFPSFALVNKATRQAIKHSIGATQPVQLTDYNANGFDDSILWTESKDLGDGYRAVRMVSNIRLNIDAFNGDKNHGGVRDGTNIVLWEWKKGDNQRWKIVPYCKCIYISACALVRQTTRYICLMVLIIVGVINLIMSCLCFGLAVLVCPDS